ncbi:MAG: phytanoyl-CoA dioxygenase family protein [Pseudomonadota bacterium]
MPSATPTLSQAERHHLLDHGYVAVEAFVARDEVDRLRIIVDRLFSSRAGWEDGNQFDLAGLDDAANNAALPQLLYPSKYAPELAESSFLQRAREIAASLFGNDLADDYGEHMIVKPPYSGSETPWHQDQAYHDPAAIERSINFWMPLDDTDEENGCMHYVPGSNRHDVLPHHSIGDDPRVHGLEVDNAGQYHEQAVACPLLAGGCVMHLPTTLHYAGPNTSSRQRRAYILIMQATALPRDRPIDNYWMREKRTARAEREAQSGRPGGTA